MRFRTAAALLAVAGAGLLLAAGCQNEQPAPPPTPPMGGPPGGPGTGGPGGPGGRMGRGGMRGGPALAENASGAEVYSARCQGCHGANGTGGRAPSLAGIGDSAAALHKTIHDGKGKMPAFGSQLSDGQIDKVVEYLKGLGKAQAS